MDSVLMAWDSSLRLTILSGGAWSSKVLRHSAVSLRTIALTVVPIGWAVGVTSYRRTGLIVADAIKDLNNLRNHVCNEFGYPYWVFLDGRSMGGAVRLHFNMSPSLS